MASIYAMENEEKVDRLTLLAPALNLLKFSKYKSRKISIPVSVYHGTEDEIIPINEVKTVAGEHFLDLSFHPLNDDHLLSKNFKAIDWPALLGR